MGVKALQCFPWYGRRKERKRSKNSQEAPPAAATTAQEEKPRLQSTNSVGSDTDGQQNRAYFSGKARVSFRHQMDSTMFVNDSTF